MKSITIFVLLFIALIYISTLLVSCEEEEREQQQQQEESKNMKVIQDEEEIKQGRTLVRQEIQDKLIVGAYTCRYGCKCHESEYGPSAYKPSLHFNCAESSSCYGEGDINCCKCSYYYYPPGMSRQLGYNYIPCCAPPPTPPTPSPTLNCDCSCRLKFGYATCTAHQIGDGSNLCYGGGGLDSICCGCPSGSAIYQYNCCRPTVAPTKRPTKTPTFPTSSPSNRPTKAPTAPTPPTTRRPTLPTSSPTVGSTVPCGSCSCYSGLFSTNPLDISQFYMCCPSSSSLSYSCKVCC